MDILRLKGLYWISIFILILTGFIVGHVSVMLYYPYRTIDIKEPMFVLNSPVIRGEDLSFVCNYKKYINRDAEILSHLHNLDIGNYVMLPVEYGNIEKGEHIAVRSIRIPKTVVVGNYILIMTVKYKMNPIRTVTKKFKTEKFMIVDSK